MIKVEQNKDICIISFPGISRLNVNNINEIKEPITEKITPKSKVILDLAGITYIDSSGFGVLLSFLRTSKTNESCLMLCGVMPEVMGLVKLLQLQTVFNIQPDRESCFKNC